VRLETGDHPEDAVGRFETELTGHAVAALARAKPFRVDRSRNHRHRPRGPAESVRRGCNPFRQNHQTVGHPGTQAETLAEGTVERIAAMPAHDELGRQPARRLPREQVVPGVVNVHEIVGPLDEQAP
jgi:hypothetical protein